MYRFWQRLWDSSRRCQRHRPARPAVLRPRRFRPSVEALGERLVLSTLVSTTAQLRAAITNINTGATSDSVIDLAPGTYNTEADGGGTFTISASMTLEAAPGAGPANVVVDGNRTDRVFDVLGAVTAEFDGLTIQNGSTTGDGAGIDAEGGGIVLLTNSVVTNNTAIGNGGGIAVSGGSLTANNSTFASNTASGGGGGIFAADAAVALDASTVHDANTAAFGGGIALTNFGGGAAQALADRTPDSDPPTGGGANLMLTDSTIDGNTTTSGEGGGIFTQGADLTITRSTISRNTAVFGGGGVASVPVAGQTGFHFATIRITNSTIAQNTAAGQGADGGGILIEGVEDPLFLTNVTITANTAFQGGGIFNAGDAATLLNTIVAGNSASADPDVSGTYASSGHNLIGAFDPTTSSGFTNGTNNDQVGTTARPIDPRLGPLQFNGGPTVGASTDQGGLETAALLSGSPAIDAGQDGVVTTDERGVARPQGAHTDIGAFEFVPPVPAPTPAPRAGITLLLSPTVIAERTPHLTFLVGGANFTRGSVVLVDGRPLPTIFVNSTLVEVPDFLGQVNAALTVVVRRHGHRQVVDLFDEGTLLVTVVTPGVARPPGQPVQVVELVAPGDIGTPFERFAAQLFEDRTHTEADTSPAFQHILAILRMHGL